LQNWLHRGIRLGDGSTVRGQSLLLAKRQYPCPVILFIQARNQMPEMTLAQYRSGLIISLHTGGIVQGQASRTQRQEWFLWQE
jgi:hypothetical protein